jgi:radical SAM superfamily enzyme YgiQ (UPF0313 family)
VKVVLISTYDLGRQPFNLASPAAWLLAEKHDVTCVDTAVACLPEEVIRQADLVAISLPMHTATRLAVKVIERVKALNPNTHLACYGLYAPMNADYLRTLGVHSILGGEFEPALVRIAAGLANTGPLISLDRLQFRTPDRTGLPPLARYAKLHINGTAKKVGYTEATRGCKHLCRHCPVVPVYNGAFRVVQQDIVLEDIRRQVSQGASHITFGDPDFFNGPTHARRIVEELHNEYPAITYDVTIKIEHLLQQKELLPLLKTTGCLFVTSAVESVEDSVLAKLEKGHTRADFINVAREFEAIGLTLAPTFLPFTPWTTRQGFQQLLNTIAELGLIENVNPVQLALRLLIPSGSRLLELDEIQQVIGPFNPAALMYPWKHTDPSVDELAQSVMTLVNGSNRQEIFQQIWQLAHGTPMDNMHSAVPHSAIPYLDEAWYCCAEPTEDQLARV